MRHFIIPVLCMERLSDKQMLSELPWVRNMEVVELELTPTPADSLGQPALHHHTLLSPCDEFQCPLLRLGLKSSGVKWLISEETITPVLSW